MSTIEEPTAVSAAQNVALWDIFTTFVRISVMSFGGSTAAWSYRAVVEERKWLDNDAFVAGMTLSQVMPGANPVNVSLYVGQRLRGTLGALVGALGMISPALVVVLVLAVLYARLSGYPVTHFLLLGIAAAGVGATFSMGAKVAVRIERKLRLVYRKKASLSHAARAFLKVAEQMAQERKGRYLYQPDR